MLWFTIGTDDAPFNEDACFGDLLFTTFASLCDRFEPPGDRIPYKMSPSGEAWETASLQRGIDFDIFACTIVPKSELDETL